MKVPLVAQLDFKWFEKWENMTETKLMKSFKVISFPFISTLTSDDWLRMNGWTPNRIGILNFNYFWKRIRKRVQYKGESITHLIWIFLPLCHGFKKERKGRRAKTSFPDQHLLFPTWIEYRSPGMNTTASYKCFFRMCLLLCRSLHLIRTADGRWHATLPKIPPKL